MELPFVEEFFSARTCTTTLLGAMSSLNNIFLASSTSATRSAGVSSRPHTPSSSILSMPLTPISSPFAPLPSTPLPYTPSAFIPSACTPQTAQKKRKGKRNFTIFVDTDEQDVPLGSATQRSRLDCRVPLAIRTDSANSTPAPSPRPDDLPFPYSPTEFFEVDQENWDPNPTATPPPTPAAFPHSPSAPTGPPPPLSPRAHITRPRYRPATISPPRNMVLYEMLGLHDWNVSKRTIMTAWRQTAIMAHPDKVPEDEREAATTLMQQVNAAAEVLSHRATRRQYHIDGVLPWAV